MVTSVASLVELPHIDINEDGQVLSSDEDTDETINGAFMQMTKLIASYLTIAAVNIALVYGFV